MLSVSTRLSDKTREGGKCIWGGVQWTTKKERKKDSSGRLWQCSDSLICYLFFLFRHYHQIRSSLRFFFNYSLWRKTRRESQPRHQNWAGLAPTGRRPLYEVSLYAPFAGRFGEVECSRRMFERSFRTVFEACLNSNYLINGGFFKIDRGVCRSLKSNVLQWGIFLNERTNV